MLQEQAEAQARASQPNLLPVGLPVPSEFARPKVFTSAELCSTLSTSSTKASLAACCCRLSMHKCQLVLLQLRPTSLSLLHVSGWDKRSCCPLWTAVFTWAAMQVQGDEVLAEDLAASLLPPGDSSLSVRLQSNVLSGLTARCSGGRDQLQALLHFPQPAAAPSADVLDDDRPLPVAATLAKVLALAVPCAVQSGQVHLQSTKHTAAKSCLRPTSTCVTNRSQISAAGAVRVQSQARPAAAACACGRRAFRRGAHAGCLSGCACAVAGL